MFRYLLDKFFRKEKKNIPNDFKNSQGILIRPDGSWVVVDNEKPSPIKHHPYAPSRPHIIHTGPPIPGKDINWYKQPEKDPHTDILDFPPEYFPYRRDLHTKLEQCIEKDIIVSCVHKQTENKVYILSVELPCSQDQNENMKRFKLFIRAMEDQYKFKTIQQERLNSSTCNDQQYLVVFEYDPKLFIMKKIKQGE